MTELAPKPPAAKQLTEAADAYRQAVAAVEEYGRESLEQLAEAHEDAHRLLAQYEGEATETGIEEFVQFAQFKQSFTALVDSLDEELPAVEAFEAAQTAIDKRRLTTSDFETARRELAPVRGRLALLEEVETARDRLVDARQQAAARREELIVEHDRLHRVKRLGTADLNRSVAPLRDPITTYNEAVQDVFQTLRSDRPAREYFAVLTRAQLYPLVALPEPPARLHEYLTESPAGTESIATLLEYLDYSPSKLQHYIDDPTTFRRTVATERSFLTGLGPEPVTIDWPPPPADRVPHLTRSRRRVIGSYLDADANQALRQLEALARDRTRYQQLRETAVARAELTDEERAAVSSGAVAEQLADTTAAIDAIEAALEAAPDP